MDDNLEWLTQKTEDSISNKGNLTFPTHAVNVIELSGNKKVATPHFYINPPFQIYPPFLAKNFILPKWLNFQKVLPPPFNEGGFQLWIKLILYENDAKLFKFKRSPLYVNLWNVWSVRIDTWSEYSKKNEGMVNLFFYLKFKKLCKNLKSTLIISFLATKIKRQIWHPLL